MVGSRESIHRQAICWEIRCLLMDQCRSVPEDSIRWLCDTKSRKRQLGVPSRLDGHQGLVW